jgi:hypothetical protein
VCTGRCRTPSQRAHEQVHPCAGDRERQDERDVILKDRVSGQPVDGRDEDRDAEQVFGKRERVRVRIEDRRVPHAGESVPQMIRVPRENPRVEQRIERVRRQRPPQVRHERQCGRDRQDEEPAGNDQEFARATHLTCICLKSPSARLKLHHDTGRLIFS